MAIDRTLLQQYYAGICVNIISISYGAFCGWPSASFLELQADNSPLDTGPMSNSEAGLVGSMLCVGGILGTMFFAWCSDRIGRKRCLLLVAIPALLGWTIIIFARNPWHLCMSRFFGGFAGGGSFSVIPIYTTEFSETRVRGTLGAFIILSCNLGILCAFILGNFFSYGTVALILSSLVVLFLVLFSFLPDSPQYLLKCHKTEAAEKALRYFRNIDEVSTDEFQQELEQLKSSEQLSTEVENRITWKDFTNPTARKALTIGIALLLFNQLCGGFAMINYTATIFKQAGSNLSPNTAAIVVAIIQLMGSYISTIMVERAGRKTLLSISTIAAGIGLLCLGSYSHLTSLGYDTRAFKWLPVASFSFVIFIASWGILTLPFLVVSEIMPPRIRNVGNMICISLLWIAAFFILMYFPIMSEVLGMHGVMFFFASNCFIGAAFITIFVPETKGKSIEAILASL